MAVEQPMCTEEPLLVAVTTEEQAGSSAQSSGSDDWCPVPGEDDGTAAELATFWQKKAEEQERLRLKAESELIECRNHWQQQVQEAEARKQEAKEEASMWQAKANQQSALRVRAEAEAAKWENKAEREDGLRKKAERDAMESEQQAKREENWRLLWEEKAMSEESLCKRYQQEVQKVESCQQQWQKKAEEQARLLEEQAKVLEKEKELRHMAEASASEWQSRAQRAESCQSEVQNSRGELEQELERWKQKADAEETFRRQCERKVTVEEGLRKEWQERALQREQDLEAHVQQRFEEKLMAKDAQLAEAEVAASQWHSKAEEEGQRHRAIEQEVEQWKKKFEEEESLRNKSEMKAEAFAEELRIAKMEKAQDAPCMSSSHCVGQYCVTHTFQNIQAARKDGITLMSPQLGFFVPEDTRFSYSFMLQLCPKGSVKDGVGLLIVLLPGSGELLWPFPCDKVKIVLRTLSPITSGAEGPQKRNVKEVVLDEGRRSFQAYVASHAPPRKDNSLGFGARELLTKAEFDEGGWTSGPNLDDLVVQAELIFKKGVRR